MSLYTYEVFEKVADKGSFAKAAEAMHLTPSAISHAVAHLEKEFGFPLFLRGSRGVMITKEGERVLPMIRAVMRCNESVLQEVGMINNNDVGLVKMGVFHSVAVEWIPKVIKSFKKKYPNIEVEITQGGYREIAEAIGENKIDIGIVSDAFLEDKSTFEFLRSDPIVCVVPEDFETENEDYISIEEIKQAKVLMQRETADSEAKEFLLEQNIKIDEYLDVDDDNMMVALVEQDLGISFIPLLAIAGTHRRVNILELEPPQYRYLGYIVPDAKSIAPATQLLIHELRKVVRAPEKK